MGINISLENWVTVKLPLVNTFLSNEYSFWSVISNINLNINKKINNLASLNWITQTYFSTFKMFLMQLWSISMPVNPQIYTEASSHAEIFLLSVMMPENCEQLRADGNIPAGPKERPRPSRGIPSTHPLSERPWEAQCHAYLAALCNESASVYSVFMFDRANTWPMLSVRSNSAVGQITVCRVKGELVKARQRIDTNQTFTSERWPPDRHSDAVSLPPSFKEGTLFPSPLSH